MRKLLWVTGHGYVEELPYYAIEGSVVTELDGNACGLYGYHLVMVSRDERLTILAPALLPPNITFFGLIFSCDAFAMIYWSVKRVNLLASNSLTH